MKSRLLGLTALAAFLLVPTIRAEDKAAEPALKCPVSGEAASKDHAVDFEGGKVYFCCDNCPKEFAKSTAKFAAKAHHQMVLTSQLVETKCPFTGKDLAADKIVEVDGVKVAFCCMNCQKKAAAMSSDELLAKVFTDVSKCYKLADAKAAK